MTKEPREAKIPRAEVSRERVNQVDPYGIQSRFASEDSDQGGASERLAIQSGFVFV